MRDDHGRILAVRLTTSVIGLFLAAAGCGPARVASERASPEVVVVGTWNIEWLGRPERRGGPSKDVAQRPEDLAWYIERSGVDVLALQEIKADVREGGVWRNTTLEEAFAQLNERAGASWTHELFPDRRDGTQITGVAWNRAVVAVRERPLPLAVSNDPGPLDRRLWDRPPWAMQFSAGAGRTDFVVIPLHQKSNYGGDYAVHRAAEMRELVARLDDVRAHFADDDIIVIGDTNCPAHDDEAVQALVAVGFRDGNAADEPTSWRGGGLDRTFTPRDESEFVGQGRVLGPATIEGWAWTVDEFRRRCSDHFMITTQLRVIADDDGPG